MPKGEPSKNTIRTDRWSKKNGYITKGFKMYREQAEAFKNACEKNGEAQSAVITRLMQLYIDGKV